MSTWILDLDFKIPVFLSVGPEGGRLSNCFKIHLNAVFSLLTAVALVHPLGFLKEVDVSQLLTIGPFAVDCNLS